MVLIVDEDWLENRINDLVPFLALSRLFLALRGLKVALDPRRALKHHRNENPENKKE